MELTGTLIEEVCDKLLQAAREEVESVPATPTVSLATAALLLASQCLQLLTRLQTHLPSSVSLPELPLQLHRTPSQQLLPAQWVGVAPPQQPAVKFLLVSISQPKQRAWGGGFLISF